MLKKFWAYLWNKTKTFIKLAARKFDSIFEWIQICFNSIHLGSQRFYKGDSTILLINS